MIPSYPSASQSAYADIASDGHDTVRDSTLLICAGRDRLPSSCKRSDWCFRESHKSNACNCRAIESSDGRKRCTAHRIRSSGQPCTYNSPSTGTPSLMRSARICGHDVMMPPPRVCMVRERGEYQQRRPLSFGCTIHPVLTTSHVAYSESIGSMCNNLHGRAALRQTNKEE